jgi:hypothetical protein
MTSRSDWATAGAGLSTIRRRGLSIFTSNPADYVCRPRKCSPARKKNLFVSFVHFEKLAQAMAAVFFMERPAP